MEVLDKHGNDITDTHVEYDRRNSAIPLKIL